MTEIIELVDKDNKTIINIFQVLKKVEESKSLLRRMIEDFKKHQKICEFGCNRYDSKLNKGAKTLKERRIPH